MNRSAWDRAKSLLADAADLPAADRERFVMERCGDPDLRRELLELLASPAPLSGVFAVHALSAGDRLGPYAIDSLLGIGGMGEVYRGTDTRLGRDVALKVISPALVGDPSLRRRFEVEARAASALNHPAIVTVYDVGETDGLSWIAMEWVDGRTLRQALAGGPLPIGDVCAIAVQIVGGLAAAHARGVVHRDLKPENIMVAADGRVRILDFGLARQTIVDPVERSAADTMVEAPTMAASAAGTILGTVGYMSPEQASGRAVDFRSDQFAVGLIAYEMLAGRRAFARLTAVETLTAVIREDPLPLPSIRSDIPDALVDVVARCLAKNPDDRFASTRDLAAALAAVDADAEPVTRSTASAALTRARVSARPRFSPMRRAGLSVAVALLLAVAAAGWNRFTRPTPAIDSLAVLPFANTSGDPDAEYLGDGLTESLIGQMSRVPTLRVMARATSVHFKGTTDPRGAGRALGVGAVVTGTVARRGDAIAIAAELIDPSTGARLWGETYDRPIADLQRVQDSIASDIADALRLRLSAPEKRTLVAHGTENPEAYELSLRARFLLPRDTEEDDLEARRLFQQAVDKDPAFVQAHVGIAGTYARSAGNGYAPPAGEWRRADAEFRAALDLDPGNVAARSGLAARRLQYDWDWSGAEREFREVSRDPRLFLGNQYHPPAIFFVASGRPEDAIELMARALRVDPQNVESRIMMADFRAYAGHLDEAIRDYRAILATAPSEARALFGLADVLKRRGEITAAIDALRNAYEASMETEGVRALAAARTEQDYEKAEVAVARVRLADLDALARQRYVSPLDLARLQAQVGDREGAFANLDLALAERSPGLIMLKVDRAWDRIRGDARFAALVRRVGIP